MKLKRMLVAFRREFYNPDAEHPVCVFESRDGADRGRGAFSDVREMVVAVDDDGSVSIVAPWEPFTTIVQEQT